MRKPRITLAQYLVEFGKKNDLSKYDFTNTVYAGTHKDFTFKCREHGDIISTPSLTLKRMYPCYKCREAVEKKEWVSKAKLKHGDKYDYDKVILTKNSQDKVKIYCPEHGYFMQNATIHLIHGCLACSRKATRATRDDFINRSNEIHDGKYDYSKVDFKVLNDTVTITCPEHGDWKQRAASHLAGNGCKQCYTHSRRMTTEEFIAKAKAVHGKKYDYSKVKYVTSNDKVKIICKTHGPWLVAAGNHLNSLNGCPRCIESFGELTIRNFLLDNGIEFEQEYKMPGTKYRIDFYLSKQNIFIEHHGIQHYRPVKRFGGEEAFISGQKRDNAKKMLAAQLRIPMVVTSYRVLKDRNLINNLIYKLTQVYKYWFKDKNDNVVTFANRQELESYLNIRAISDTVLYQEAYNKKSLIKMF